MEFKPDSKFLTTNLGQIHYLELKKPSDDLVILFHPYSKDSKFALKTFSFLQEDFHLIALDLPYHGRTSLKKTAFEAKDISQIIEKTHSLYPQKRLTLIGHSFGARIICLGSAYGNIIPSLTLFYGPELGYNGYTKLFLNKYSYKLLSPLAKLITHEKILSKLTTVLFKLGLINQIARNFLELHNNVDSRSKLLLLWKSLCATNKDLNTVKLNTDKLGKATAFFGDNDKTTPHSKFVSSNWNLETVLVKGSHFQISHSTKKLIVDKLILLADKPSTSYPSGDIV
jgi:pimeloyl-ACP methyl ester carboxylesterase